VDRLRDVRRVRRAVGIGAPDPRLTSCSGMVAVTELVERLGVVRRLDAAIGPIKSRRRGHTAGELLVGLAAAQLAGEDFLVGLDRQRADAAGQVLAPVAGLASTTAAGLARRFTEGQWRAVETAIGDIATTALAGLPPGRAAALCEQVTIDLDTTDVEVYGRDKRGVAYNYQGQRGGRPHVATWSETATVLAADLMAGDEDPRGHAAGLLKRALAALPAQARAGRVRVRTDAGYFAGELARAAQAAGVEFAIGAKRIAPLWRLLGGIAEDAWTDAIDMTGAQVAVADYRPDWWPAATQLLIRRVRLSPEQVSSDPRSRRRRTLHPDQRALPIPELATRDAIYAYSFIATNLDVSTPSKTVAVEHRYRHRTTIENIFARQQTRRRAATPPLRISRGQPHVDVGRTARRQPRRLATPPHRHPHTGRTAHRARRPRRPSHDRHPAPPPDPRTSPPHPPRRRPHPAPPTRTSPTRRDPHPTPNPPRNVLTRPHQPRTPPEPAHPRRHSGINHATTQKPSPGRSTTQTEDQFYAIRGFGSETCGTLSNMSDSETSQEHADRPRRPFRLIERIKWLFVGKPDYGTTSYGPNTARRATFRRSGRS
jgi:hypothetical protein